MDPEDELLAALNGAFGPQDTPPAGRAPDSGAPGGDLPPDAYDAEIKRIEEQIKGLTPETDQFGSVRAGLEQQLGHLRLARAGAAARQQQESVRAANTAEQNRLNRQRLDEQARLGNEAAAERARISAGAQVQSSQISAGASAYAQQQQTARAEAANALQAQIARDTNAIRRGELTAKQAQENFQNALAAIAVAPPNNTGYQPGFEPGGPVSTFRRLRGAEFNPDQYKLRTIDPFQLAQQTSAQQAMNPAFQSAQVPTAAEMDALLAQRGIQ